MSHLDQIIDGSPSNLQANSTTTYLSAVDSLILEYKLRDKGQGCTYIAEDDKKFIEVNEPIKKGFNRKILVIGLLNFIWIAIICQVLITGKLKQVQTYAIFVFYVLYLGMTFHDNGISTYLSQRQSFQNYQNTFDKCTTEKCFFKFQIECFHKTGGKNKKKIVTHQATQQYFFQEITDNSGQMVQKIKKNTLFTFIHYTKTFSFGNKSSKNQFFQDFDRFISDNKSDTFQEYHFQLEIPEYKQFVCYKDITNSLIEKNLPSLFVVSTILGLALPFLLIIEFMTARYEINIHKIVSNPKQP